MTEFLNMVLAVTAGLVLGVLYFGGLWLTVKKAVASKLASLWLLGSFLFRISITLAGFYFISAGSWPRLIVCLCGFVVARLIITRLAKRHGEKKLPLKTEAAYEN